MTPAVKSVHSNFGCFNQTTGGNFLVTPQWNQLFHPSNLLTDYLKQTAIMELLISERI